MWLPADERRILAGYSRMSEGVGIEHCYDEYDLCEILRGSRSIDEYGHRKAVDAPDDDGLPSKWMVTQLLADQKRVRRTNELLASREMIQLRRHETENHVVLVALTPSGSELGTKYATFGERMELWYESRRKGILGALVGLLVTILIVIVKRA